MSTMTRTVRNALTGWSFDLEVDHPTGNPAPGGLILKTMRHDGHNFARDVRLIGIWLKFETVNPASQAVISRSEAALRVDANLRRWSVRREHVCSTTSSSRVPNPNASQKHSSVRIGTAAYSMLPR